MTLPRKAKPVHILSGFLGSGKTTFLNHLLKRTEFANSLVIVNEFGEISLDHLLVESSTDTVIELANGCLCCSIRGDLLDTLLELRERKFNRIFIETTGIADPVPIMQALAGHPEISDHYILSSALATYDVTRGQCILNEHDEAIRQIAVADTVVFTKTDLLDDAEYSDAMSNARSAIAAINPSATILKSDEILRQGLLNAEKDAGLFKNLPKATIGHSKKYRSICLRTKNPLSKAEIQKLIDLIAGFCGNNLLRIKGLVLTKEMPKTPLVLQVSGNLRHDDQYLNAWRNDQERQTQLVVIVKEMDVRSIKTRFNSVIGALDLDTPDKEAVFDNPLSAPGFTN